MFKFKSAASLVLGFFECLLFSMTIVGWPNLVIIFKDEGVFSFVCPEGESPQPKNNTYSMDSSNISIYNTTAVYSVSPCLEQDSIFTLCFSVTSGIYSVCFFLVGLCFDKFGMWVTRIIATLFFVPSCFLLAFTDKDDRSYLMFPGSILMGISGVFIMITSQHIPQRAGSRRSTVTALYSGATDCGVISLLVVKLLYEEFNISHRWSLLVFAGLWSLVLINTFAFCPRYKIPAKNDTDKNQNQIKTENDPFLGKGSIKPEPKSDVAPVSFLSCCKSPCLWLAVFWCCLMHTRNIFTISSLNLWLTSITNSDQPKVSTYTSIYSYIGFGGIIVAPLVGVFTDYLLRKDTASKQYADGSFLSKARTLTPVLWMGCVVTVLHSALVIIEHPVAIYTSFVLLVFLRAFFYGTLFVYMATVFPLEYFGKCVGLCLTAAGIFCQIQNALFVWAGKDGGFKQVHIFLIFTMILTTILPFYIQMEHRKKYKK